MSLPRTNLDARRPWRRRRTKPTLEHLLGRFDHMARSDGGYRKLTLGVCRALRPLLPLLDEEALRQYLIVEQAVSARDVFHRRFAQ